MKKCFSVCIVLALFLLSGLFFPRDAEALKPNIDLTVSANSIKPGDTIIFNITIESNYRLQGDSVEVRWGDGSHPNFPCVMAADYATPPQECSFSAQYIYSTEKDYFAQVKACSDEAFSECELVHTTIHVVDGTTIATTTSSTIPTQYDNPLSAEDIPQFVWQILEYFSKILIYYLVPLLIIIGAYVIVTSGGSSSKVNRGKKIIIWTLAGFVLILLARGLIALVQKLLGG